jgi:hypothetical protein
LGYILPEQETAGEDRTRTIYTSGFAQEMSKSAVLFRPGARLAWFHAFALAGVLWVVLIASAFFIVRANSEIPPQGGAQLDDQTSAGRS